MYFQFLASKTFQCNFFFAYSNFTERDIFKFSCNFLTQFFSFFLFFFEYPISTKRTDPNFPQLFNITISANIQISWNAYYFQIFLSDFLILPLKLSKFFYIFKFFWPLQFPNTTFFSYDIYVYNISKFSSTISNFRETHGDSIYIFSRLELYYTIISFPKFFVSNYQQMKKPRF